MELNISEASGANYNWIQAKMYYYNTATKQAEVIDDTGDPNTKNNILSWEGIWVLSKQNNINLIRRNQ